MRAFLRRRSQDIIWCDAPPGRLRVRQVGGKGWNLLRLRQDGFPVPAFCVVSSRVFARTVRPVRGKIEAIVRSINFCDREALERAACAIREIVLAADVPPAFQRQLDPALDRLLRDGERLAVRSSVVGEDSSDHSFAGQMDSFLNVTRQDVLAAVREVWVSAFSARALCYRKKKNLPLKGIATAVILQEMVNAAASGILFTKDPETGRNECLVSAGFGLGDGVVTNRVETDTYRLPRTDNGPLTKEVSSVQVLTDTEILRLCGLGVEIEKDLGIPQDIEWAGDRRGRLVILQARPIMFAAATRPDGNTRVWDNSNIIESYPGLTLPLTFSFVRGCYEIVFQDLARCIDPSGRGLAARDDVFGHMIGLLGGRVYYNLLNWYEILSYLPGFNRHRESWDRMIGISQNLRFPEKRGSPWSRARSSLMLLGRLLAVRRTIRRFFACFDSAYADFGPRDFSRAGAADLMTTYDALKKEFAGKWYLTLLNDFCAMSYYEGLRRLCSRWGLADHPNLHNDLLCGEKGIESTAPVRLLVRLAETVRGEPSYLGLMVKMDDEAVWKEIQRNPTLSPLKKELDEYLRKYGDRGTEELKLETPTYREAPELLVGLVRRYLELGLTVEAQEARERDVRQHAERLVRERIINPLRKLVFIFVLRNARRALAGRENMRFARARLFGIIRRISRRAGAIFAEVGLIDSPLDIYYLTMEEVISTVRGTDVGRDLRALVSLRKSEYVAFARLNLKDRFVTRGIPNLNLLADEGSLFDTGKRLKGINCSAGVAEGPARVVLDPHTAKTEGRYILVAKSTDPGWVFLMVAAKGIVVERGSVLSHTAIIGRELGIPTIVGVRDATRLIPDGANLFMDGSTGDVRWQ
jgi:phosphohistidine swiveling domain-containing protein